MKLHVKLLVSLLCMAAPLAVFAAPSATCAAHGQAAFEAFTHGQYNKVNAHFAPSIDAQATPAKLKQIWQQLESKAGKYQKLGKFKPHKVQGHDAMVAPMSFSKMKLAAVFACDAKGRITSWVVLDPAKVPGLLPST